MARISQSEYKRRNMLVWNEVAPRYHKRWASTDSGPFQSTAKLVELLAIKEGSKILDVACGTGVVVKNLASKVGRTGYVVGADTSVAALNIARKWNAGTRNLHFVNMDAERLYFAEKFDVVTCQYALFFFPNAARALKNMRKSLAVSGRLGIAVHGTDTPFFTSILDAVTEFIPDYIQPGAPALDRYATRRELKKEVRGAGFSGISVRDFVFKYSPGGFEAYWQNYQRYVAKPLKAKLDSLTRGQKRRLKERVRSNIQPYVQRDGTVEFPWQVLILTAKN